ncbi:MAG TPA: DUF2848 domain-containing protein [Eoetvoesiella sp.]|uniref:DUF2848 domain-containing protein n=1 Tax=Eoetvoesiella sp. TaxID=1966355 RepID=UPI002C35B358|nr:DUF2848 domain-containing protein [Eoetvoesiella sp.]HWK60359.1 DUF2848 domain-containing protein [Eoetvoesiella sp.]
MILKLNIESRRGAAPQDFAVDDLVIAGWAGRDKAAVEEHIVELEALGIARPASTPLFYRVAASRLTTHGNIQCWGAASSGEAETVLFAGADGRLHVGLGSDHTDRKVEAYDVSVSKQMCDKPVAGTVWPFDDVADHWDSLILRSFIQENGRRVLYQEGKVDALLAATELIHGYTGSDALAPHTAMFGGTLTAIGAIRPSARFEAELEDPVLARVIRLGYNIVPLPV